MHVEVQCVNVNWHVDIVRRKRTVGAKRSIDLLKRHKNSFHVVVVYEVLIKPGIANIHPQNGRIQGNMRLFWH